jgi:hypothetical protein
MSDADIETREREKQTVVDRVADAPDAPPIYRTKYSWPNPLQRTRSRTESMRPNAP